MLVRSVFRHVLKGSIELRVAVETALPCREKREIRLVAVAGFLYSWDLARSRVSACELTDTDRSGQGIFVVLLKPWIV